MIRDSITFSLHFRYEQGYNLSGPSASICQIISIFQIRPPIELPFPGSFHVFESCYNVLSTAQRHFLVAAGVIVTCLVASPESAHASCGDYVIIGGAQSGAHSDSAPMASSHSGSNRGIPMCRGAGCQQRRHAPASAPQRITLEERGSSWLPELPTSASESWALCAPSEQPLCAIVLATGMFRPPRTTAGL